MSLCTESLSNIGTTITILYFLAIYEKQVHTYIYTPQAKCNCKIYNYTYVRTYLYIYFLNQGVCAGRTLGFLKSLLRMWMRVHP